MKIVSITILKNESDIVESFVRYNINIFDEMIILDNGSTDETIEIIRKLQNEALPIILIEDSDNQYNQREKLSILLKKAVEINSADIVVPLDADEFLSSDNGNPREILEKLDENSYYQIPWETYVATAEDDPSIGFIPSRLTHVRDEKYETLYKVIVPKKIVANYDISLQVGQHDLIFEKPEEKIDSTKISDLKMAHFPLRSVEQCMSKILIGWPSILSLNKQNNDMGFHMKIMFEKIKEKGRITFEDMELFSRNYCLREFHKNVEIREKPLNVDFCEDIEIKYRYDYNYMRNVLDNYVKYVEMANSDEDNDFNENEFLKNVKPEDIKEEWINFDKDDNPKVSVVIPVYNNEKYLNECLDSVIGQTFKDIEIICINNGSTDGTLDILKSYASKDDRVKIISHNNIDVGPARNDGLAAAKGQYVYIMDSDDYIYPDAIEDMYNSAVLNDSDIVLIKYEREVTPDRSNSKNGFYLDEDLNRTGDEYREFTFTYKDIKRNVLNTYFNHWMGFYKREFLDKWDELTCVNNLFEDVPFHIIAFLRAERISHIPKIYYHYRRTESSQMSKNNRYIEIFEIIDLVEEYLIENGFMEEFKDEMDLFIIVQCLTYLTCANSEFFQKTKNRFSKIKLSPNHIVEPHRVNLYGFVLQSDSYTEYLKSYYSYMLRNANAENYNRWQEILQLRDANAEIYRNLQREMIQLRNSHAKTDRNLQNEINQLKNRNAELESENSKLKELNSSLINSNSWKLTKPLRNIKQIKK